MCRKTTHSLLPSIVAVLVASSLSMCTKGPTDPPRSLVETAEPRPQSLVRYVPVAEKNRWTYSVDYRRFVAPPPDKTTIIGTETLEIVHYDSSSLSGILVSQFKGHYARYRSRRAQGDSLVWDTTEVDIDSTTLLNFSVDDTFWVFELEPDRRPGVWSLVTHANPLLRQTRGDMFRISFAPSDSPVVELKYSAGGTWWYCKLVRGVGISHLEDWSDHIFGGYTAIYDLLSYRVPGSSSDHIVR